MLGCRPTLNPLFGRTSSVARKGTEISQPLLHWIALKFHTDTHGPQRFKLLMALAVSPTFHLVPSAGQSCHVFSEIPPHLLHGLAQDVTQTFVFPGVESHQLWYRK